MERKLKRAPIGFEYLDAYLDHMEGIFRSGFNRLRELNSPPSLTDEYESFLFLLSHFPSGMREFLLLPDGSTASKNERAASAIIQTTELEVLFQCDDVGLVEATDRKTRLLDRYLDDSFYENG